MIGINGRIGQGWRMGWITRRAICTIAERCSVITCLEGHRIVTVVAAVGGGQTIGDDTRRSVCGEDGGDWGQVIGIGRLA